MDSALLLINKPLFIAQIEKFASSIWKNGPQTCEDPHGPVHGIDVTADQHFHQQVEELWPGLRPVPVGDGRHGVCDTGADFADGLSQATWQ